MWEIDLSGSTAMVTGASRGIGRAIAVALARAGSDIVGVARSEAALAGLCREVRELGPDCLKIVTDLEDPNTFQHVVETSWDWHGSVDILVNAAGMVIRTDPPAVTAEEFDRVIALNLKIPFLLCQELGWRMRESGHGNIVNVASLAGEEVTGAPLHYQASKAALIHLTRGFASRLAPNVRVNAVGPGYIRTSLNEDWLANAANEQWVKDRVASGEIGVPNDIGGAVVFLVSPEAAYINGQHLRVDGGWGL